MINSNKLGDESIDLSQYTVLVVDDEQNILLSLQRLFYRETSYKLICANSGAEALKLLAERPLVAVIVSDQRMPEMNGSEFLALSRDIAPDAIRMLLTGYSDMEATVAAMNKGGATHYISKPWNDSVLLQTVRDGIRQYHLIMENRLQQEIINKQNKELSCWNDNLKERVMSQTIKIRKQMEDLRQLNSGQKQNFQGVIESLATLLELRNPRLRHHSANTATLSIGMAESLELPADEIETIRIAALLHDIGKNVMSDVALATEESNYTDEEMSKYRTHPLLGQIALASIEDMRPAGILIRHHHERNDGRGFPDGLAGDEIPIGSAIITLADRCDREMSFHVASNAVDRALENLAKNVGKIFSPTVFKHLANPAHKLYDLQFERHEELIELEVAPSKLKPGMLLTRDLFSRSGMLLLQAWTELDYDKIVSIIHIFKIDPKPGGIHVAINHSR